MGPKGAELLGEALRANKSLMEIDLRENGLGPVGMKDIAQALAENDTLETLHLQVQQSTFAGQQRGILPQAPR